MARLHLLVIDGNTRETDEAHKAHGGTATGEHYLRVLTSLQDTISCHVVHPARPGGVSLPTGVSLASFDGAAWSGSSLNIYNPDPGIPPQLELCRALFQAGVPQFGSCWGLQVAAVAAGGEVRANPQGRELGIARGITPNAVGLTHPLFAHRSGPFDAIAVHRDEVVRLPPNSRVLAGNAMSAIQAAEIKSGAGTFWGVQYHPEYDLNEISSVILRHGERLVEDGFFSDISVLQRFVADLRSLHANPARMDLAWLYGIDKEVLDAQRRRAELRCWLAQQVAPYAAARAKA